MPPGNGSFARCSYVRGLLLALTLAGWLGLGAASGAEAPLNKKCPVLTDQDADPDIFIEYQGKKVWFCCGKCKAKFLQNPAGYLANLPQFKVAAPPVATATSIAGVPVAAAPAEEQPSAQVKAPLSLAERAVAFAGRFHPAVVHFPIALLLAAALAEILYWRTRRAFFTDAARFMVLLGAAAAVVAMGLGWAADSETHFTGTLDEILDWHSFTGTATSVLAVICAGLREGVERGWRFCGRRSYLAALFGAAALVAVAGFLGGVVVYGPEHYSLPK